MHRNVACILVVIVLVLFSFSEPEEEFRYTTLSTFIGDFFCSWCKQTKGTVKRKCLRFCFKDILNKYDETNSVKAVEADLR